MGRETEIKMSNLQSFWPCTRAPSSRCRFFILYVGAPGHAGYITRLLCGGVLRVQHLKWKVHLGSWNGCSFEPLSEQWALTISWEFRTAASSSGQGYVKHESAVCHFSMALRAVLPIAAVWGWRRRRSMGNSRTDARRTCKCHIERSSARDLNLRPSHHCDNNCGNSADYRRQNDVGFED